MGFINFFFPKKKKLQKEVGERAARPHPRTSYRPKKFRPHLTQEPSVQMCCHRGIADSPNRGFFPTKRIQHNPNLISRPAPRAPYGHRRGLARELPSAHKLQPIVGEGLAPPAWERSDLSLPLTGEGDHEVVERAVSLPLGEGGSQRETDEVSPPTPHKLPLRAQTPTYR